MATITILKSELMDLENKIERQEALIQSQKELIKAMNDALIGAGVLPAAPGTPPRSQLAGT